jgi:hypothetical protein
MKLWIDCEFNDFQGELISMALVDENGREFYEVLYCENPSKWVAEHVMPILGQMPISRSAFQAKLQKFLSAYESVEIIADWPEDIKHFCESLITGPGTMFNTPPIQMTFVRVDSVSKLPHNALADAHGIRRLMMP